MGLTWLSHEQVAQLDDHHRRRLRHPLRRFKDAFLSLKFIGAKNPKPTQSVGLRNRPT